MRQWQRRVSGHDCVNAGRDSLFHSRRSAGRDSTFHSRGNAAGTFAAEHALVQRQDRELLFRRHAERAAAGRQCATERRMSFS